MAIIKERLPTGEYVWGKGKAMLFTRLVKPDIIRHGTDGFSQTAQQVRTPQDQKTAKQTACRIFMQFLTEWWLSASSMFKNYWRDAAPNEKTHAFATLTAWNFPHFIADLPPTSVPDDEPYGNNPIIDSLILTPGPNYTKLLVTPNYVDSLWGYALFRSDSEIVSPTWSQLTAMRSVDSDEPFTFFDKKVPSGSWHYRCRAFNLFSRWGPPTPDQIVTIV
jgi:hypothetical protein